MPQVGGARSARVWFRHLQIFSCVNKGVRYYKTDHIEHLHRSRDGAVGCACACLAGILRSLVVAGDAAPPDSARSSAAEEPRV